MCRDIITTNTNNNNNNYDDDEGDSEDDDDDTYSRKNKYCSSVLVRLHDRTKTSFLYELLFYLNIEKKMSY